jgi:tetratricopeptide (TPR) repeat protein
MNFIHYMRSFSTIWLVAFIQFGAASAAYSQTSVAAETAYRELAKSFLEKLEEARTTLDYKFVIQIAEGLQKEFPTAKTIHQRMNCHLLAAKLPTPKMQINAQRVKLLNTQELEKTEQICFEGLDVDPSTGKNYLSGNYTKVLRLICLVSEARCNILKAKRVDPPSQDFGGFGLAFDFSYSTADDGMNLTEEELDKSIVLSKLIRPLRTKAIENFNEKKYTEAIHNYSELIQLDPYRAAYFASRALAKGKLRDFAGGIADLNTASLLEPKDGDWPLQRSWLRYSAGGDWRGVEKDVKIAESNDRDNAIYVLDRKANFLKDQNQRFLKSVAKAPSYVRFQQKEWDTSPLSGYWFRYEYADMESKIKVRMSALDYKLNAFSQPFLEICDLNQNTPCRKQLISGCNVEDGCEDIRRNIVFKNPILKIFSDLNLQNVLLTVPLQFQQWDTDSPKKNTKIYTPGLSGALMGPYRPDEVTVFIDPTFKHLNAVRILAVRRFQSNYDALEPIYGYIDKKLILEKTTYFTDPEQAANVIEQQTPPSFSTMPRVQSPYNAVHPMLDPRRVVISGTNSLLGKYAFVRIFSGNVRCSGTVVGSNITVVTAGHCLNGNTEFDVVYTARDGREIKRRARLIRSPFEDRVKLASQIGLHPNQQGALYASTDWAILKLESKFNDEILPLPLADLGHALAPSNRSLTYIVGFPGDVPTNLPTASACFSSHRNSIDTRISWSSNDNFIAEVSINACVSYNGNSGGGAIILENGQPKFLGVVSGGGNANFISGCNEYSYDQQNRGKEKIALQLLNDADAQLLVRETGKKIWSFSFDEIQKNVPHVASLVERVVALSKSIPSKSIEIGSMGSVDAKKICQFKDYAAPFVEGNKSNLGLSTWLFKDIQSLTGAKYTLTPIAGITHLANPVNGYLLHADFRDWIPSKAACLLYQPRPPYAPGQTINLSNENTCEVPATILGQSTNLPQAHLLSAAVVSGSLVLYNKSNKSIVAGYEGVVERCAIDPDYFCRLHDVINLPQ